MSTTSRPNSPPAKTLSACLVLLVVEFLHGTLRVILLVPRVRDLPSRISAREPALSFEGCDTDLPLKDQSVPESLW